VSRNFSGAVYGYRNALKAFKQNLVVTDRKDGSWKTVYND